MLIEEIHWRKPYRDYQEGFCLKIKDRVAVIVGDNGSGKSTLLGLLREHFDSHWTPSSLPGLGSKDVLRIEPPVPNSEKLTYVDLVADHMGHRTEFDSENMSLQVKAMGKSAGQASMIQLTGLMGNSEARIHLIDEPERGLSPTKQWVIAAALKEITEERPEDQFLITTHSPQFMKTLSNGEVLALPEGLYCPYEDYLELADANGRLLAKRYLEARRQDREEAEATKMDGR